MMWPDNNKNRPQQDDDDCYYNLLSSPNRKKSRRKKPRPPRTSTIMPRFPVDISPQPNKNSAPLLLGAIFMTTMAAPPFVLVPLVEGPDPYSPSSLTTTSSSSSMEEDDDHDSSDSAGVFHHHTSTMHKYFFPFLTLFPLVTICGNVLVVLLCSIMVVRGVSGRSLSSRRESLRSSMRKLSWSRTTARTAAATATNFYLISLASADLLIGALVMPFSLYLEWTDGLWSLGNFACDLWLAIDILATTASILSLAAIAQNRYLAIARPVTYSNLQRKRRIIFIGIPIGIVWSIATAVAAPVVLGLNDVPNRKSRFCKLFRAEYLLYTSVVSFFIPSVAIGLQYVAVFRALGERARRTMMRRVSVVMSRMRKGSNTASNTESTVRFSDIQSPTVHFDDNPVCRKSNDSLNNGIVMKAKKALPSFFVRPQQQTPQSSPRRKSEPFLRFHGRLSNRINDVFTNSEDEDELEAREVTTRRRVTLSGSMSSITSCRTSSSITRFCVVPSTVATKTPQNKRESIHSINDEWKQRRQSMQFDQGPKIAVNSNNKPQQNGVKLGYSSSFREASSHRRSLLSSGSMRSIINSSNKVKHHRRGLVKRIDSKVSRERRATIMLTVVLVLFYSCWVPYFVATVSKSLCSYYFLNMSYNSNYHGDECVPDIVMHVLAWLGHANSMANPFVYAIFNPDFRAAFTRIFSQPIIYRLSTFRSASSIIKKQ